MAKKPTYEELEEWVKELEKETFDRKQAERLLRKRGQKLEELLSVSPVVIYRCEPKDNFPATFITENIRNQLGYEPHEFTERSDFWASHIHPDDAPHILTNLTNLFERGYHTHEYRFLHKDGTYRWMYDEMKLIYDVDGKPTDIVGNWMDITDRKQAEEALRDSEEKYRLLIENATDAIFIAQEEVVKFPNPKTEGMIGYTKEELAKISFVDLIHPEDRDMVLERHKRRLKGEELPSIYSFRVISKAGDELWVQLNTVFITWEGRPATLNFIRDITEQKKLEAQLQQAQKMEAIGTLAGGIAHDFNNILAAIIGFAELAKMRAPEDSEFLPNLDQILKSGNRAKTLIQQILAFSRKQELEQKPLHLKYIVKESLKLLRATLPTDIEIKEDIAKDVGVVNADPTQMHQVIMNLCTNAGHAMQEEGGVLAVGLANVELDDIAAAQYLDMSPGRYLRLSVSDTGHGMTSDVKDRIFEPYFTTKDKGVGTGLGLSVVKGIVDSHGGTITVYSEPGKGSTFHVYLPLIEAEVKEPEMDEQTLILTGNERILFIDDEPTIVEIGKQMLERLGYEVTTRTSSIEALELFRTKRDQFDLVITDMTMPNMTGDKLAKELMKIRSDIPIILCIGFSERISEEKAKGMGIKAFGMKPLVMQDLANTVRRVLDEK